jgi:hypothetical protein
MKIKSILLILLACAFAQGCGPKRIPGIEIDLADIPDHRALLKVLNQYKTSLEAKDIDGLLALASPRFYEDSGTSDTGDDYSFEGLSEHFVHHFKRIKKIQLNLTLKKITANQDRAQIDYRYVTRYLMDLPAGEKWRVVDELNRMELVRENGTWKIINGM